MILSLFVICQSCGTTSSGSFDSPPSTTFAQPGANTNTNGLASAQSTYTIKLNTGLSGYFNIKEGLKNVLVGSVSNGVFKFTTSTGTTSSSGITVDVGSGVPSAVSSRITEYLQQNGYSVVLRKNQSGLGKTVSIW
jgi:hypothetical protein